MTRLFTGEVVSYEGRVVCCAMPSSARSRCNSRARRSGSAAVGRRAPPLVARYADVWHTWGTPNSLREANERLKLAADAGRDPSSIQRASLLSLDDLDTARKHAAKWREAGYHHLICGWPGAGRAQEAFATSCEFRD